MKNKRFLFASILSIIILIFLNVILLNLYRNNIYRTYNDLIANLIEKYPEDEKDLVNLVLNSKSTDVLNKYGVSKENINEIAHYRECEANIIIYVTLSYLFLVFLVYIIYKSHDLKIKREMKEINLYLQEILKGSYELNIADYNEDELSILKNDIYKVTIKLKELSIYEKNEQIYLMRALEDISHQLKTPLTALILINDILKNKSLTEKERNNFLLKQSKELERMDWLITTLLKYSKLDSGSVKLKKDTILANELIHYSLEPIMIQLELKEIEVVKENLNFKIVCDINWTKEALTNILKNAYEHVDVKGKIVIKGEENPLYQEISITDNGCGISKVEIKNIFKRFYSMDKNNSFGIGLHMAKLIIELQNGSIEVDSEKNAYTCFKIRFYKTNKKHKYD